MISQAVHEVRFLHDLRVPMRDGVTLSADVYLPRANGPFPVIYQWTPYESARDRFIAWGIWFAQRGYAAIVQDVRGRYESGGEFHAYFQEGADASDPLDWVAARPWSNGRGGTWGRAYGAIVPRQLVPHQHPNLVCMAPHVIFDDYFSDCHYVGGAFQLALSIGAALIWSSTIGTVTLGTAGSLFLNQRTFRHLPLIDIDRESLGREIGCWRDWLRHPTYDDYWRAITHTAMYGKATAPMFQQGGWYDAYAGAHLRAYNELIQSAATDNARRGQRVLMGPWSHEEEVASRVGDREPGPEAARFIRDDELRLDGPSYSADTLDRQRARGLPTSQIFFITGADAFADIATWQRYTEGLDLAHFVVVARPGHRIEALPPRPPALALSLITI